jgi:hypothetical protein
MHFILAGANIQNILDMQVMINWGINLFGGAIEKIFIRKKCLRRIGWDGKSRRDCTLLTGGFSLRIHAPRTPKSRRDCTL